MPSCASSPAVPPVETISTPRSASPRAKSTRPRLSDTLSRARRMRTSPAAVRWVPRGSIAIVGEHQARIGGIEAHTPLGDQANRARQEAVFEAVNTLFDIGNGVRIRKLQRLLKDDRT